jgi:nicotinamidase-related amidase
MEHYFVRRGDERYASTVEGNVRLLQKAREAGVKVVFIQSVRSEDALEFTVFNRPLHLLEGTDDITIVEEIAPLPGESVVEKRSHDPWLRTELDSILQEAGLRPGETTAIVTGVSASVCARACALGFSHRDYMTLIAVDCTAASTPEHEAMAFAHFQQSAYSYNTDFTTSSLVEFVPAGAGKVSVLKQREAAR